MSYELIGNNKRLNRTQKRLAPKSFRQKNEDEQLLLAIAKKDRKSYSRLYLKYQPRLTAFCARTLQGDYALAADIVDEALFEVWKSASRFAGRSSVSTWIYSITRNRLVSYLRKTREILLADEVLDVLEEDQDPSQLEQFLRRESTQQILGYIDKLTTEHQEILTLVYFKELSVKQIADMLELPENTVKTRMFYARKRLKRLLQQAGLELQDFL